MSIDLISQVWKHSRQNGTALLLLLAIADYANQDNIAWPKLSSLADKTRLKERQTQYLIQKLVAAGELEILRNGHGRGNSMILRVIIMVTEKGAVDCTFSDSEKVQSSVKNIKKVQSSVKKGAIQRKKNTVSGDSIGASNSHPSYNHQYKENHHGSLDLSATLQDQDTNFKVQDSPLNVNSSHNDQVSELLPQEQICPAPPSSLATTPPNASSAPQSNSGVAEGSEGDPDRAASPAKRQRAKKATRESTADPRSSHPAIQGYREVTAKYPSKELYNELIQAFGDNPDLQKAKILYVEWVSRGYNGLSIKWATEWYAGKFTTDFQEKQIVKLLKEKGWQAPAEESKHKVLSTPSEPPGDVCSPEEFKEMYASIRHKLFR